MNVAPKLNWETLHMDGENILVHFQGGSPLHLIVIPREVLEDAMRSRGTPPQSLANENREVIQRAADRAWNPERLKQVYEVTGTGLRNTQLWLTPGDF